MSKVVVAVLVTILLVSGMALAVVTSMVNQRPPWHSSGEWSFDRKLRDEGFAAQGGIAIHNSTIHAAYVDYPVDESEFMGNEYANILYVRSDDYGKTWSPPMRLSRNVRIQSLHPVAIVAEQSYVGVLWRDWRYVTNPFGGSGFFSDAVIALSRDRGLTWEDPFRINQHNTSALIRPSISISGDTVLVGYSDIVESPGSYFRISTDGGRSWTNDSLLPLDPSMLVEIRVSEDVIYAAHGNHGGNGTPQLMWSSDNGGTWDSASIDSFDPYACDTISLLVDGDYVHTVCPSIGYSRSPPFMWNWTEPNTSVRGWILQDDGGVLYSIGPESEVSNGVSHLNLTVRRSNDVGDTWTDGFALLEGTYPEISSWSVSICSGRIGVIWTRQEDGFDTQEVQFKVLSADDSSVLHEGWLTSHLTDTWANLFYSLLFVFLIGVATLVTVLALHVREKIRAGRG